MELNQTECKAESNKVCLAMGPNQTECGLATELNQTKFGLAIKLNQTECDLAMELNETEFGSCNGAESNRV